MNFDCPSVKVTTILPNQRTHSFVFTCSFDRRGKISEEGTHWKNNSVIGNRAFFRTSPDPATLILEDVKLSDSSSYRCRVDFQRSPTKNNKVRLQVMGE